jgi:hypothetical protein
MIDEWLIGKNLEGSSYDVIMRYCPGIFLERLRKATKHVRASPICKFRMSLLDQSARNAGNTLTGSDSEQSGE